MSSADEQQDDPRFEEALAEYLRRIDRGEHVDQAQFIAEHAEFADALREYFETAERVERMAAPPDETLDSDSPPTASSPPLDVIRYFGDYELLEEIGRGGMGVVYRARQVTLKRIVALKMILAGQLASDDDVKRFHTEAEAAANLQHPGIVPIFEIGLHEGQHYFSMGFVDGESLARKVAEGPLPPREAAQIIEQVTRAIAYAHEHGVIHRDLKPGNVLIDRDGQPHIADFGLAKRIEDDSDLTRTGQIVGTPSYMSPEQASGSLDEIGPTADVHSLGAILYTLIVGRPPFQSANVRDTLNQVKTQEPVSPRQLNAAVPRDLETICLKCLEKERHRRYASAEELADDLRRVINNEPIKAKPVSRFEKTWLWCKRTPAAAAGLIATVLFFVVIFALFAYSSSRLTSSTYRHEIEKSLTTVADTKVREIRTYVRERKRNVTTLARSPVIIEAVGTFAAAFEAGRVESQEYLDRDADLRPFLTAYQEENRYYDLLLISLSGDVVFTVMRQDDFAGNLFNGPYRDTELAESFQKAATFHITEMSDFRYYPPSNKPVAFIAAPVFELGRVIGVVALQVDVDEIHTLTGDYTGLGDTGEWIIASREDDQLVFVSPLRYDSDAAFRRRVQLGSQLALPMQRAVQGQRGSGISYDYRDKEVLAVWHYMSDVRWGGRRKDRHQRGICAGSSPSSLEHHDWRHRNTWCNSGRRVEKLE